MHVLPDLLPVSRRSILGALLLAVRPLPGFAAAFQRRNNAGGAPPALTPQQFDRLVARMIGKWRTNPDRSTYFEPAPAQPLSFVYTLLPGRKLRFTNHNGTSVQGLDGQPAPGQVPRTTIARVLHDEFTMENIVTTGGRVTTRNTQVYSPDGRLAAHVTRVFNERGDMAIQSFAMVEKVSDDTVLWFEQARR